MASPDVFLSSPIRRSGRQAVISSSPELPSVQDILLQKPKPPPVRSGSQSVSHFDDQSPTSARVRWKSAQAAQVNQLVLSDQDDIILLGNVETGSRGSEGAQNAELFLSRKPQPSKSRTRQPVGGEGTLLDNVKCRIEQPWKKYKATTPEKEATQAVSPTKTEASNTAPNKEACDETRQYHSPMCNSTPTTVNETKIWNSAEPLLLEPAMIRRKDWTPPSNKSTIVLDSDASGAASSPGADVLEEVAPSFGSIVAAFKLADTAAKDDLAPDCNITGTKKRKSSDKIHCIDTIDEAPKTIEKPARKPKAPRKKPRTITALATAAYKQATQADTADEITDIVEKTVSPKAANGKPARKNARKKPSKAPRKKAQQPKPVLLSPGTALKEVAKQDFVFGTSSQLALEQSPTFLRDLQIAMTASKQLEYVDVTTPLNSDAIEPLECRPKLWDAAARDDEGDLFDEAITNIPEVVPTTFEQSGNIDPFGYIQPEDRPSTPQPGSTAATQDDSFLSLSDTLPTSRAEVVKTTDLESSNSIEPVMHKPKFPSTQTPCGLKATRSEEGAPLANGDGVTASSSRPTFEFYTDTQLAKEVCQYGFKPIKRRSAMIALLDQCWQQRNPMSQQHTRTKSTVSPTSSAKRPRGRPRKNAAGEGPTQEPPPSAQAPETPKRQRGRPRKDAQASPTKPTRTKGRAATSTSAKKGIVTPKKRKVPKVIEIPDSESDMELGHDLESSPMSLPSSTFSSPRRVDLTLSVGEDTELSLTMTPTDIQTTLFTHITRAVKTAPRTADPAQPSWHEKILLYDPIVLEDLASWLNSGQLSRVGYDEEVSPGHLKKWCESKSICCLWRVNLRGQERKRY